jgi:pimeloyl-ACP methyl ester carboxylesterase
MHVLVNGVRLFFDVEGGKLAPDGPTMREKPTLILLHGGPGFDHTIFKPAYSALADIAQVVYLDHRGNGRSDAGPKEAWTLAQWGDDVRGFCDALGIEKPVVLGVSFGGVVAMSYATRHPDHPSKLILITTEAKGDSYLERAPNSSRNSAGPRLAHWPGAASWKLESRRMRLLSPNGGRWRCRTTRAGRAPRRSGAGSCGRMCCSGSPARRTGRGTGSTSCPTFTASPVRRW